LSGTLFPAGPHCGEIRGPFLDWRDLSGFIDAAQLEGVAGGFDQVHVADQLWIGREPVPFEHGSGPAQVGDLSQDRFQPLE